MSRGLVFPALLSQAGTPRSSVVTSAAEIPLPILNRHTLGMAPARSASPPLLPISMYLMLYIFNYRTSVQLVLRRFSAMAVLQLSCNSDVVMGGGGHSIYFFHHLERKSLLLFLYYFF